MPAAKEEAKRPCPRARPCVGLRMRGAECASGKNSSPPMQTLQRRSCQTRARLRKKACAYGVGVSGATIFAYVGGDPVNFSDPDGLQARPPRGGGATQPMFPPIGPTIRPSGPYSIPTQGTNPRYYNYTGGSQGRNTDGRGNARDIFREMTGGRATESLPGGNGVWTELPNGTRVNYRETPIGPRIDIYPPRPGSPETLHFPGGPIGGVCLP